MTLNTPQTAIPPVEPKAPLRSMLPGVELRNNAPLHNKDYTTEMLDVLDRPTFINPWALPPMTIQPLEGLIQPIPQQKWTWPKEFVPKGLNDGIQADCSEGSGVTG